MQILIITPAGKTVKMDVVDEPDVPDMDMDHSKIPVTLISEDEIIKDMPSTSHHAQQMRFAGPPLNIQPKVSNLNSTGAERFCGSSCNCAWSKKSH